MTNQCAKIIIDKTTKEERFCKFKPTKGSIFCKLHSKTQQNDDINQTSYKNSNILTNDKKNVREQETSESGNQNNLIFGTKEKTTREITDNLQHLIILLKENLDKSKEEEALNMCSSFLIPFIHEIGIKHNIKLFDNYNYRTYAIFYELRKKFWYDLKFGKERTGVDAYSDSINNIEFKTYNDKGNRNNNILKASFMWNKQDKEGSRERALDPDYFVFGYFINEKLQIIIMSKNDTTKNHILRLIRIKQKEFEEKNTVIIKNDAIRINISELFSGNVYWNIWIREEWYENIISENCIRNIITKTKK